MEMRKAHVTKFSDLPKDYVKMVNEVFAANFDAGLKALKKLKPQKSYFSTSGRIYADEIILCVSLMHEGQMAATSVYASIDYDAKASSPTIQDLLAVCVDAVGAIYGQLLVADDADALARLTNESLAALENVPFDWSEVQVERHKIFLKVDKANPALDQMTEDWLDRHDPSRKSEREEEEKETEKLFVTGPKRPDGSKPH